MAGDWIKMRCNLDTDPAVFQMAAALEMDELAVVGRLWKVWSWADQHCADCNAVSVTRNVLDRITATPGFADAMQKVGWLEGLDGALSFPHFDRHNGQTAKKRALTRNRVEKTRADSVTLPALQERYQRREEKSNISLIQGEPPAVGFTEEQVIEAGRRASIAEDICRAYYDDRMAAGWFDKARRPVRSMPHDLANFARHWRSNENPKQFGSNGSKKAASVWELKQSIEQTEKEISRLVGSIANKVYNEDGTSSLRPDVAAKVKQMRAKVAEMRQAMSGMEVAA